MNVLRKKALKFVQKTQAYEIEPHPQSDRLYHINISTNALSNFLEAVKQDDISVQHLEYTPYARHIIASYLLNQVGEEFAELLRSILHDRQSGGFTIGLEGATENTDEYVIGFMGVLHLKKIRTYIESYFANVGDLTNNYLSVAGRPPMSGKAKNSGNNKSTENIYM